jgi:hypothetical protein
VQYAVCRRGRGTSPVRRTTIGDVSFRAFHIRSYVCVGKAIAKSQEAFVFLGVWGKMQNTVSLGYLFASADGLNLFVMCAVGYIVYSV